MESFWFFFLVFLSAAGGMAFVFLGIGVAGMVRERLRLIKNRRREFLVWSNSDIERPTDDSPILICDGLHVWAGYYSVDDNVFIAMYPRHVLPQSSCKRWAPLPDAWG